MRTFIISLKPSCDSRNLELIEVLARIGFEAEVFSAVNGRQLAAGEYFDAIPHYLQARGHVLTPSELGCSLSHIGVFKQIVAEGVPSALVLEDDVLIDEESLDMLSRLRDQALFEQGLIHLGGQEGVEHLTRRAHGLPFTGIDGLWKINPDDLSCIYRTVGYMVSRKDAIRLSDLASRGAYLADDWAYVVANGAVDGIYICNCVGHPTALAASHIEAERGSMRKLKKKLDMSLLARITREIKMTIDSRREASNRKKRARGQPKIAWKSRWSRTQ